MQNKNNSLFYTNIDWQASILHRTFALINTYTNLVDGRDHNDTRRMTGSFWMRMTIFRKWFMKNTPTVILFYWFFVSIDINRCCFSWWDKVFWMKNRIEWSLLFNHRVLFCSLNFKKKKVIMWKWWYIIKRENRINTTQKNRIYLLAYEKRQAQEKNMGKDEEASLVLSDR